MAILCRAAPLASPVKMVVNALLHKRDTTPLSPVFPSFYISLGYLSFSCLIFSGFIRKLFFLHNVKLLNTPAHETQHPD